MLAVDVEVGPKEHKYAPTSAIFAYSRTDFHTRWLGCFLVKVFMDEQNKGLFFI
jgi:hypothetical protein